MTWLQFQVNFTIHNIRSVRTGAEGTACVACVASRRSLSVNEEFDHDTLVL